jgi:hypothetical protein
MVLYGLALYATAGLFVAIAFAGWGASRVLPQPMPLTFVARLLLLPGAFILWPYILIRWLKAGCTHCHRHGAA